MGRSERLPSQTSPWRPHAVVLPFMYMVIFLVAQTMSGCGEPDGDVMTGLCTACCKEETGGEVNSKPGVTPNLVVKCMGDLKNKLEECEKSCFDCIKAFPSGRSEQLYVDTCAMQARTGEKADSPKPAPAEGEKAPAPAPAEGETAPAPAPAEGGEANEGEKPAEGEEQPAGAEGGEEQPAGEEKPEGGEEKPEGGEEKGEKAGLLEEPKLPSSTPRGNLSSSLAQTANATGAAQPDGNRTLPAEARRVVKRQPRAAASPALQPTA